jgi:phosphoglycerol transferase MdoB-like AlkP superfamily enzyme
MVGISPDETIGEKNEKFGLQIKRRTNLYDKYAINSNKRVGMYAFDISIDEAHQRSRRTGIPLFTITLIENYRYISSTIL